MELSKENSISTEIKVTYKMVGGYVGNPKGMLLIMWERVFVNESLLERHYISGKNPTTGITDNQFHITELVGSILDFL